MTDRKISEETWQERYDAILKRGYLDGPDQILVASMLDDLQSRQIQMMEMLGRIQMALPAPEPQAIPCPACGATGWITVSETVNSGTMQPCVMCRNFGRILATPVDKQAAASDSVASPLSQPTPDPRDAVVEAARKALSDLRGWYGQDWIRKEIVDAPAIQDLIDALSALDREGKNADPS